jgi:hypothetical protein
VSFRAKASLGRNIVTSKLYLRADKRDFVEGASICTAGDFIAKHTDAGEVMEKALELARPEEKTPRAECLMLFEDEDCAKMHWAKMKGGKLYSVLIGDAPVLHRGDMRLAEEVGERAIKGENVTDLARRYWDGELSSSPCIEVLVKTGIITALIGSDDQRKEYFKKRFIRRADGPEPFENELEDLLKGK